MKKSILSSIFVMFVITLGVMLASGLSVLAADQVSCTGYWCASGDSYAESVMLNGVPLSGSSRIEGLKPGDTAVLTVKARENFSFDTAFLKTEHTDRDAFSLSGKDGLTFGNFIIPSSDFSIGIEVTSQQYEVIYFLDGYHESFFYDYNTEVKVKDLADFPGAPRREGAVFVGWKDDSGAVFTPGSSFTAEKKYARNGKYLDAQWIVWKATHKVNASSLNVRSGPGTDYGRIGGLSQDTQVMVLENRNGWSQIVYNNGFGWVADQYLTSIQTTPEKPNPFEDVYESDDYYDAVMWAYYQNPQVTNGMDEKHFGPQRTVTRGQAVTFLWRAQGRPEPSSTYNPFRDIPADEYYYKPVLWAVEKGIVKGVDVDHFQPTATLSTQHMITFLYRTKNPGKDGWDGEAADWAGKSYGGKPFGVDIMVNNVTPCPRSSVVQFLYLLSRQAG